MANSLQKWKYVMFKSASCMCVCVIHMPNKEVK